MYFRALSSGAVTDSDMDSEVIVAVFKTCNVMFIMTDSVKFVLTDSNSDSDVAVALILKTNIR